ncbi:MAG: hypothetical protein U9O96_05155 [Candidatus Thermoplasmatota archaeon]|nr:hypothetical protein [Candidatus Thermoplasmatota archaeon]
MCKEVETILEILNDVIPYISGLWTLPWIVIGFVANIAFSNVFGEERMGRIMKKVGLILLYFFIPILLFRIFLNTHFGGEQIAFVAVAGLTIFFMYLLAFFYARHSAKKQCLTESKKNLYLRTVLTNQGRSSAFIGSAMMAYWPTEAGIVMALFGIALFAIIPYILSHMYKKESRKTGEEHIHALPWFLKLYPWYLISFVIAAVLTHEQTGATTDDFGDIGILLKFYTTLTIPAALYYVGASIHPREFRVSEIRKLSGRETDRKSDLHWTWVRKIFLMTVVITPVVIAIVLTPLFAIGLIPSAWFAVIMINSFLPITSTNMFLLPYGIDKKSTAYSVTWTTLICIPIVVLLIIVFSTLL